MCARFNAWTTRSSLTGNTRLSYNNSPCLSSKTYRSANPQTRKFLHL